MAEFNSVLLGKAFKSVGNLTLVYTRRKNIVRSKVFKRKNTETPEILAQRAKVRVLGRFGRRVLPVIRKGFVGVGRGTTSNAFMSANMASVTVDERYAGTLDYARLRMAEGLLLTPEVSAEYDADGKSYSFTLASQEEEAFASQDDKVWAVLLETGLERVRMLDLGTRGSSEMREFVLPAEWDASRVQLYAFAVTKNGRMASDSVHLSV